LQASIAHGLTNPGQVSVEEFRRSLDSVIEAKELGEKLPGWFDAPAAGITTAFVH
jgi:hypothetical protein